MKDTPKWMMDVAKDFINLYLPKWKYPIDGHTHREIASIILRRCPDDKGEKLVRALKSIASVQTPGTDPRFYELSGGTVGVIKLMVKEAAAAIAEYEELNK